MRRLLATPLLIMTIVATGPRDWSMAQGEITSLQPGVSIERMLASGQSQSFSISLEQDQFLQLVVEQRGIDVRVRVFSPVGKMVGEFDSPNGTEGPENVSLISARAGVYRIEVTPLGETDEVEPGRFEIKVLELRSATAQELQTGKNQESLKAKGVALLGEVAGTLDQIRLPQTRVRAQLQAAQLLGTTDPKLVSKLLAGAIEGVKEYLAEVGNDNQDYYQTYVQAMQLRLEVLQVLGSRDPEQALSFLRSTTLISPDPGENGNQQNQELQFEVSLANQILEGNPKRAFQIAEDTLKRGYSYNLLEIINKLRSADPELAVKLAKQLAGKLQGEKLLKNQDAANLAINLLQIAQPPSQKVRSPEFKKDVSLLSEQEYRDLLEKLFAEGLSYSTPPNRYSAERDNAQNILNSLKSMGAEMTGSPAGNVAAVEKKLAEFKTVTDPQIARWQKYQEAINSGSLEAGIESVNQAPREMRDQLYLQLAQKAIRAGDLDRARQILKDHIAAPSQLQQALANLEQHAIQVEVSKGRSDEALRIIANLRTPKDRAVAITQVVSQLVTGQKRENALNLLDQALSIVGSSVRAASQEQLSALLEIGREFSRYDPKRAFEVIEPILDQFNEMSAAAVVLDGFGQQYYQDGELIMENGNSVAMTGTQLIAALGSLGMANFDRAKDSAARIERPEVRIAAYLSIAQQAIIPNERRMPSRW